MTDDELADAIDQSESKIALDVGVIRVTGYPPAIRCCDATLAVGSESKRPRYEQWHKEEFFHKAERVHQNVHEIDRRAADTSAWTISHTAMDKEAGVVVHHTV